MENVTDILFDFDWIVVDSEPVYIQTWCDILSDEWKIFCQYNYINSTDIENYEQFQKRILLSDSSLENVRRVRRERFDVYIEQWKIPLVDNVISVINFLHTHYDLSIVSNSTNTIIKKILETHNLLRCFKNFYGLEPWLRPKPAWDLYLNALTKLKVWNNNVICIEDSISWIKSSIDANIQCIAVNHEEKVISFCKWNGVRYFLDMQNLLNFFVSKSIFLVK